MERRFHVYRFQGLILNKTKGQELRKMSLKDCLDKVYNTYYDRDTERFFRCYNFSFVCNEYTLGELTEEIGKGLAVFPVSKLQKIEEVKRFIDLGLDPVFMRATDFRTFKRIYG